MAEDFSGELLKRLTERGLMVKNEDGTVQLTPQAVAIARAGRGTFGIDLVGGVLALARAVGMAEIRPIDEGEPPA